MAAATTHLPGPRLRPRKKRVEAESILEAEFEREALSTERLRLLVLTAVVVSGLFLSLIPSVLSSEGVEQIFHGNVRAFVYWRSAILLLLALYLTAEWLRLGRRIKTGGRVHDIYHYVTAFVETSCPTAEIIALAAFTDNPVAALSIPVFVYPLFIVLSALRLNFRLSVFTGAVAAVEYTLVGLYYIRGSADRLAAPLVTSVPVHVVKGLILLSLGFVTGLVALQIKRRILDSFKLAEERNNIVNTFGQHVSPIVVDKLLERGAGVRSEKKRVCVMFLDIRNFTSFAEKRHPEEVVEYLESLFEFMIEIVNNHHGIVNKFLGDGFMAVFGAPLSDGRDCANAVGAAREILSRVEEEAAAGTILPTRVGIGIHAGESLTGSIGSSVRKEYTVIGDVVNTASRIEQLNKEFGSQLLISEAVWEAARGDVPDGVLPMGHVAVRGREEPIKIYRVA
ncbi:MAG: adenylate/guanylate cyclase domain-containing protein [Acidobacteria bacterium]|nr:adenylate/guanylate cyclase domain-containing protein [Acidobacteriota bacterium]